MKNKTAHKVLVLIVLLAILTILCSILPREILNTNNRQIEEMEVASQVVDIETPQEIEAIDFEATVDTSDWVTYTNEKFGVSFKHPKGMKAEYIEKVSGGSGTVFTGYVGWIRIHPDTKETYLGSEIREIGVGYYLDVTEVEDMLEQFIMSGDNAPLVYKLSSAQGPAWIIQSLRDGDLYFEFLGSKASFEFRCNSSLGLRECEDNDLMNGLIATFKAN